MTEEKKRTTTRQTGTTIIHKLKGKKVIYAWYIRLVSGGQPVIGIVEGYNP